MKILFVASGNTGKVGTLVENQAESLRKLDLEIDLYLIKGKGVRGYLRNVNLLKKLLRQNNFDVVHAHYSFSGFVAGLAGARPLIVSLMGTDVQGNMLNKALILLFRWMHKWKKTLVKTSSMGQILRIRSAIVLPNGVNTGLFCPMKKEECCAKLGWNPLKKNILFASDPKRPEKNYELARKALIELNDPEIILHELVGVEHQTIPVWFNAADVVILTSHYEGSPNVIKEAMSCKRPIVTTNVGDVEWLFGNEPGHFIAGFHPEDFAIKLEKAIQFSTESNHTNGRNRIIELGLDSEIVARKLIIIYKHCVDEIHHKNKLRTR